MYSLVVPVPGEVKRRAADLYPRLVAFDHVREDRSLLLKRFEESGPETGRDRRTGERATHELATLRERLRPVLADVSPFEVRVTAIERFEQPVRGSGPVLYFAVESEELDRMHRRLVGAFGAVPDLEGEAYTPHVTLARGGSLEAARELVGGIEPIEWTVSELRFFDARRRETVGRISLLA